MLLLWSGRVRKMRINVFLHWVHKLFLSRLKMVIKLLCVYSTSSKFKKQRKVYDLKVKWSKVYELEWQWGLSTVLSDGLLVYCFQMYWLKELHYQIVIIWYLICPKLLTTFFCSRAPVCELYLYKHSDLLHSQDSTGISWKQLQLRSRPTYSFMFKRSHIQ